MSVGVIVAIVGIAVSTFIAYHIFWLQKNSSIDRSFIHRKKIQEILDRHLNKIKKGNRSKVILINSFFKKKYPDQFSFKIPFLVYHAAELKNFYFNGVEFFTKIHDGYITDKSSSDRSKRRDVKVFEVGFIPYEYIDYVDIDGDEYYPYPHIYVRKWRAERRVKFPWLWETPYVESRYYIKNPNYDNKAPYDLRYKSIRISESKFDKHTVGQRYFLNN